MQGAVVAWALAASVTLSLSREEPAPRPAGAIASTDAEQEAFLKQGKVVKTRGAGGGGITGALRATLRQGELQHDALVQTIDEEKPFLDLPRGRELVSIKARSRRPPGTCSAKGRSRACWPAAISS